MTRYLVTGATGMLGHHLVNALLERGDTVVATARTTSDRSPLEGRPIDWRTADLADAEALERAAAGCDGAFHCAAQVSFQGADREALRRANVDGTAGLVDAACRQGLRRVVHVSSIAAMGYALDAASVESTPYNHRPGMGYNETKRDAERIALERSEGHLDLMIVRPTLISGPGPFRRGAVASLIHRSLHQRLWVSPRGGVNVVDVQDVVKMLLAAMDKGSDRACYLAAGHDLPSSDLIAKIAAATGRKSPLFCAPRLLTDALGSACQALEFFGLRPPVPADTLRLAGRILYYDNRWSLAALGLPQPVDLDETLSRQINWERRHL